ncbi:MAG: acetyl-CoA carboxylase biotin carboxyl carrier protein [Elainellaceae cyanobacterium]
MELTFDEIRELLVSLGNSDIEELTLKSEEFELTVRKSSPHNNIVPMAQPMMPTDPATMTLSNTMQPNTMQPMMTMPSGAMMQQPPTAGSPPPSSSTDSKLLEITSPMVGTFYRSPGPEESPFVAVGDRISIGQTVCIIEAMKLMNELEAELSGEVVEILVENSEPVEYGQVLMRVKAV